MKSKLSAVLFLLSATLGLAQPNYILNSSNAELSLTNFRGASTVTNISGLPLGTVGASSTGELGVKVITIAGAGGGGGGGPVTIADGADVTLGAKADAKSTATDATPVTAMQVLKQISASVQAPPTQAVTGTFWQATQPVSGTVTTTPPANASTNLAQVAGTTTDTNSGAKSAGTLRVVLATDQPQLTAKLLVTPDSVALPANQSTNEAQINGVAPLMGAGNSGTGAQRVTISSDQVAIAVKEISTVGTTGQVTSSGSAATLVASNATRRQLTIKNTDASITVYIGPATVTTANGMPVKAGESITVRATQLWQVIAASGSPVVAYIDESY